MVSSVRWAAGTFSGTPCSWRTHLRVSMRSLATRSRTMHQARQCVDRLIDLTAATGTAHRDRRN